jgi:hypothetical protein
MQRTKSIYEGAIGGPTPTPGADPDKDKKTKGGKSKPKAKPTPKGEEQEAKDELGAFVALGGDMEFLADRDALEVKATRFDFTFEGSTKKKNVDTDEEGKFLSTSSTQVATIVSPVAIEYRDPNDRS